MSTLNNTFDRLRRTEYTGENRCMPCTIVNTIIALVVGGGIALLWPPAGVIAIVAFLAVIYLRGYLVPGTPQLTQQYFPERVLRLFGKEPMAEELQVDSEGAGRPESTTEANGEEPPDPEEVEWLLVTNGIVEECEDVDDLCLTEAFSEVWWRRIRQFREDEERAANQLAAVVDVDPDALAFAEDGGTFSVTFEGDLIAQWPSDAAFYADLAAEPTLAEWLPNWEGLGDRGRTELLAGMRAFLEECPACDADLEQVEDVRKSCCSSAFVSVSVDCGACGAQVFSGSYK